MKDIKTRLGLLTVLLFISVAGFPQTTRKMKTEHVVSGSILINGKEIPGYIWRMGTESMGDVRYSAPWHFQKGVRFMDKGTFDKKEKIKFRHFIKYEAEDIEGYQYNNDSLVYESVIYSDLSGISFQMIPRKIFMRRLVKAKISVYEYYQTPPFIGELPSLSEIKTTYANPNPVYKIGEEGKLKLLNSLNIKKELADCPFVVDKYEKGEYGSQNIVRRETELARFIERFTIKDDVRMTVIADYNNQCK